MAITTDTTTAPVANKREKGRAGEDAAAAFLLSLGYVVVSRNYQTKQGELDIIAQDPSGTFVFIEVKAAFSGSCGHPLFRVTRSKQLIMMKLAQRWMCEHDCIGRACRFDVISLYNGKLEHLKNAFLR